MPNDEAEIKVRLGRRVKALRAKAKQTQFDLADKVGVVVEIVSRLERGTNVPSLSRLSKIAQAMNVELADLFTIEDQTTDEQRELMRNIRYILCNRKLSELEHVLEILKHVFVIRRLAERTPSGD